MLMDELLKQIGERLKYLRKSNNYTQEDVAKYLNIDQGHLSNIENGKRNITNYKLKKLCNLYNCSKEYILGDDINYNAPKIAFKGNMNCRNLNLVAKMNEIINNLSMLREESEDKNIEMLSLPQNDEKLALNLLNDILHLEENKSTSIIHLSIKYIKNLTVMWMPLNKEICGCCSKNEKDYLIILNSRHNTGKQNFTFAHELYHLFFDDKDSWTICGKSDNTEVELKANAFAYNLLIPEYSLYSYFKSNKITAWKEKDIILCAKEFNVDFETLLNKIENSLINYEIDLENKESNLVKIVKSMGIENELFEPTIESKDYYTLGSYIPLITESYEKKHIGNSKKEELLLSAFRYDIVYNS